MSKSQTTIVSVLLIIAALVIEYLNESQPNDNNLIGFFAGVVFGAGIVIFLKNILNRKTK
ncbi:MAG TPA: hypothetical protein PKH79_08150 [Prolixibacteraceae bacterium]|nr:hypothetical protein [Prolixibacteraceae bacterium]HPS12263.1 hypothetical protein [Prolixibacteraceae bacterium]